MNDIRTTELIRTSHSWDGVQLHIYRDGKRILILAGKSAPKVIREDKLNELL